MRRVKLLIGLLLMTMLTTPVLMAQEHESKTDEIPIMPRLPGCEELNGVEQQTCQRKLLFQYIDENLTYPVSAVREGIEGRVIIKAMIDSTGQLDSTEILRSLFIPCDKEAVRLIESIPQWLPAERMGTPIEEKITIAVMFRLEDYYQKFPEHRPRFLPQTMDRSTRKKKRKKKIKVP